MMKTSNIQKYESVKYQESYYHHILKNGLNVVLYPKNEFNSTFVIYSTNYGADDLEFIAYNQDRFCKMPAGVAHFLEHKMFETTDGIDATEKLAALGADANAYTSNSETAYLFLTTSNVIESLKVLLDFVGKCEYTNESIEREKDIIEQERAMYADMPTNVVKNNALKLMFKENNVRNDIAGTKKSIKQITKNDLDICYNTFYCPSNMKLIIVGKFDYQVVSQFIEKYFENDTRRYRKIERKQVIETDKIVENNKTIEMDVNMPIIALGLRIDHRELNYVEKELKTAYITYWLKESFDINSDFYQNLKNNGLVTGSISYYVTFEDSYEYLIVSANTNFPNELSEIIKKELLSINNKELNLDSLKRYEKCFRASIIRSFNSIEAISDLIAESLDANMNLFEYLDLILDFKKDELLNLRSIFKEDNLVISKVLKIEK